MTESAKPRPILAIVLLFTVPLLLGVAIAPYVFNGLRELGEITDAIPKLTDGKFERVANRCVLFVTLCIIVPVLRMTGLAAQVKQGLKRTPSRLRELRTSLIIGCLSMIIIYGAGTWLGAYYMGTKYHGIGPFMLKFTEYLIGTIFIGLFEEVFFRGFIFGALRSRAGFVKALIISSIIFSGIHFLRPDYPTDIEHATWSTGFEILPYMFEKFVWPRDLLFAASLFVMGLALATFYEKRGNLYFIIGLHGGWVLAMRTGSYLLDRDNDVMFYLFGRGDLVSKGWLALIVVSVFFIAALMSKKRSDPDSGSADTT